MQSQSNAWRLIILESCDLNKDDVFRRKKGSVVMFEILFTLLVCACTWLGIREIRKPRRKRKVKQSGIPLVEQLFGVPFHTWICMKLWPDRVMEELLVTIQTEKKNAKIEKTETYSLSDSGLWVPAR